MGYEGEGVGEFVQTAVFAEMVVGGEVEGGCGKETWQKRVQRSFRRRVGMVSSQTKVSWSRKSLSCEGLLNVCSLR